MSRFLVLLSCGFLTMVCAMLVLPMVSATFKCYTYDSDKDPKPKISDGCKACINVTLPQVGTYPWHTQFTQGCSYDEEKTMGCRPVDENGTMCTCDTELCNGDGKPWPTSQPLLRAQRLEFNREQPKP